MTYEVKKYNGVTQALVTDGGVDLSTPIKLIGKNYIDYGLLQNENFLHITENFAGITPPRNPIEGMVWYDATAKVLKFYSESNWKPTNSAFVSATAPSENYQGSLWWNTQAEQLYVRSGAEWKLLGPLTVFIGDVVGNSDTASRLKTPRNISLTGAVTGTSVFDGSTNISINTDIPVSTPANNGLMASVDKIKLNSIEANAQRNVPTNLSNTATATQVKILSSTGIDTTITSANTTNAGIMAAADKAKLDLIELGAQKNIPTNLSIDRTPSSVIIANSNGLGITIGSANDTQAGVMTPAEYTKLRNIQENAQSNVPTNLGFSRNDTSATISSSTGSGITITAATSVHAGLMTPAEHVKLSGLDSNAQRNAPTNLGINLSSSSITLTSSTGADVVLPPANTISAGLMTASDKIRVDNFSNYLFVSGVSYTVGFTNIVGSFDDSTNFFDVFPPAGKSMSNLVAFIPSIHVLHFNGVVNRDDSLRCSYAYLSNRIRVYVQNTEQRSTPAANYLAIWR
jgi:hypothetical protein